MTDIATPSPPNGASAKPVKICPWLPCSKDGNTLSPTPCLQAACAVFVRVTDDAGSIVGGECAIMLLPSSISSLPERIVAVQGRRGFGPHDAPIIKPV